MTQKEIRELLDLIVEKDIAEFELERGGTKLRVRRNAAPETPVVVAQPLALTHPAAAPQILHVPAPAASPAPEASRGEARAAAAKAAPEEGLHLIKSPIVGTFYAAPSPDAPAFVKPGDQITAGQVLCIVEAMKLMNEIESDSAGEIVKCHVANGQPVEYGEVLFSVRRA